MNNLKEFLQRDDIQQLLSENKLDEVYDKWEYLPNVISSFLIENGINPLEYMDRVPYRMFAQLHLKHLAIPNGIKEIGEYAFGECNDLTNIVIPDSVTIIGNYAFYKCSSLTSVSLGNRVIIIGGRASKECTNLTNITIADSVTNIGYGAFSSCDNLTSITIPDSVTNIGDDVFKYCPKLTIKSNEDNEYVKNYCSINNINWERI